MASLKVQSTRNYLLFRNSSRNREVDKEKHAKLKASMERYGFDPARHIVCKRNAAGELEVMIGQNRLAMAEELGLEVWYMVGEIDIDPAEDDATQVHWNIRDYAQRHATAGRADYQEILAFADQRGVPIGCAAALLAGQTGYSNVREEFLSGTLRVKDRAWAHAVASLYGSLTALEKGIRGQRLLAACMAVCRVPGFSAKRLLQGAQRCPEKLKAYATRDHYLEMMEQLYNYGQRGPIFGLKAEALNAMRERNPAVSRSEMAS